MMNEQYLFYTFEYLATAAHSSQLAQTPGRDILFASPSDAIATLARPCARPPALSPRSAPRRRVHDAPLLLRLRRHRVQVINNVKAGVVEPAMSKVKSLRFATEAAITILRIDDFIKINAPR